MYLCDGGHVTACMSGHGGLIGGMEAAAQGKRSLILSVLSCKAHMNEPSWDPRHRCIIQRCTDSRDDRRNTALEF